MTSGDCGIRLAMTYSSIDDLQKNEGSIVKRAEDGILEIEYGYYPQKVVKGKTEIELEKLYISNSLNKTQNTYSTYKDGFIDGVRRNSYENEEYEYLTDEPLVHYFIKTLEAYNNEEYVKLEYFDENGILTKAKMYLVNEYFSDCIYALRKLVMSYEEGSCLFEEAIKLVFSCLKYEFPSLDNNYKQVLKDYYYKNKEKLAEKRIIINEDYFDKKNEPHYVYLEFPVLNPCNMYLKDVAKSAKVSLTFKNKRAMNKYDFSRIDAKYLDLKKGDTLKIKARFHTGECAEDLYDYIKLLDDDHVFERVKDKDGYFDEGDNTLIGLTYITHEGNRYEFEDVFKERFIFNRSDLVFMPSYMDEDSLLYLYVRNGVPQLIVKVTDEDRML